MAPHLHLLHSLSLTWVEKMSDSLTFWLDWFGVAVFAVTGAFVASRKQMDLVGFVVLGTATGIGGGSIRDALLGNLPAFWVGDGRYLLTCFVVSSATFFLAHIPQSRYALVLRLDAIGLAIFAVVGAETALLAAAEPVAAVAMGVITATFGGIIRDVLGGESPVVLRKEIYVTAAFLGSAVYVGLVETDAGPAIATFCGFTTTLCVRLAALHWQWALPRYRPLRNSR